MIKSLEEKLNDILNIPDDNGDIIVVFPSDSSKEEAFENFPKDENFNQPPILKKIKVGKKFFIYLKKSFLATKKYQQLLFKYSEADASLDIISHKKIYP